MMERKKKIMEDKENLIKNKKNTMVFRSLKMKIIEKNTKSQEI